MIYLILGKVTLTLEVAVMYISRNVISMIYCMSTLKYMVIKFQHY